MSNAIYMDANATTPPSASALAALEAALRVTGNPSSVHGFGRAARGLVDRARVQVAQLVGAKAENVIFVAGGTEANNLALASRGARPLIVSGIEHDSVLKPAQCAGARVLRTQRNGQVDLDDLAEALREAGAPAFVSIMLANNETGVIQPVRAAADLVHAAGGLLHCDASQAPGRISLDMGELGADILTVSAHKIGGVLGAGALVLKGDLAVEPLLVGGGQEKFRRAGTENVPAIAAFGAAAEEVQACAQVSRVAALRDRLEGGLCRIRSKRHGAGPGCAAAAEHLVRRGRGQVERDAGDGTGSRGLCDQRRVGLFIRQGQAEPRRPCDGLRRRDCADPRSASASAGGTTRRRSTDWWRGWRIWPAARFIRCRTCSRRLDAKVSVR